MLYRQTGADPVQGVGRHLCVLSASFSKHFLAVEVRATGPLRLLIADFLGIGLMVADLRHLGTMQVNRERLKIEVNTSASWSAQSLNTLPDILVSSFLGVHANECPPHFLYMVKENVMAGV